MISLTPLVLGVITAFLFMEVGRLESVDDDQLQERFLIPSRMRLFRFPSGQSEALIELEPNRRGSQTVD